MLYYIVRIVFHLLSFDSRVYYLPLNLIQIWVSFYGGSVSFKGLSFIVLRV